MKHRTQQHRELPDLSERRGIAPEFNIRRRNSKSGKLRNKIEQI
jgi:hypothetical protein